MCPSSAWLRRISKRLLPASAWLAISTATPLSGIAGDAFALAWNWGCETRLEVGRRQRRGGGRGGGDGCHCLRRRMGRSLGVRSRRARRGAVGLADGSGLDLARRIGGEVGFRLGLFGVRLRGFVADAVVRRLAVLAGGVAIPACAVLRRRLGVGLRFGLRQRLCIGLGLGLLRVGFDFALRGGFCRDLAAFRRSLVLRSLGCAGRHGSLFGRQRGERIDRRGVAGCRGGGFAGGREIGDNGFNRDRQRRRADGDFGRDGRLRGFADHGVEGGRKLGVQRRFGFLVGGFSGVPLVRAGDCGGFLAGHGGFRGFIGRAGLAPGGRVLGLFGRLGVVAPIGVLGLVVVGVVGLAAVFGGVRRVAALGAGLAGAGGGSFAGVALSSKSENGADCSRPALSVRVRWADGW